MAKTAIILEPRNSHRGDISYTLTGLEWLGIGNIYIYSGKHDFNCSVGRCASTLDARLVWLVWSLSMAGKNRRHRPCAQDNIIRMWLFGGAIKAPPDSHTGTWSNRGSGENQDKLTP